jgi:hypothetical protein
MGNRFGNAKILHGLGHSNPNLLANTKKVINCCSAGENNSRVLQDVDALLPEILRRNTFNPNEGPKINL